MATARKAKPATATEKVTKTAAPRRKPAATAAAKPAAPRARKATAQSADHAPSEKEIQLLAYKLWEERGRPDGASEEDWARAVDMLKS